MNPTVLITGTSSGIGLATAKYFLENGYRVIATIRNFDRAHALRQYANEIGAINRLNVLTLDVSSQTSVEKAFRIVTNSVNQLDALVNNAGFGYIGSLADMSIVEFKDQFETNVFGVHRLVLSALPLLEKARGTIINVGSVSGLITFPLSSAYCASKHALEAYTEGLWMELKPIGIHIYLVEPGTIRTNFYGKGLKITESLTYMKRYQTAISVNLLNKRNGRSAWRSSPDVVAKKIYELVQNKPKIIRHFVGRYSFILPLTRKILPTEIFYRILQKFL